MKKRLLAALLLAFVSAFDYQLSSAPAEAPSPPVTPNRTVPKVDPPKPGLEFSASPTPQELFRARIFEEPLVPIGGEPSAADNSALAAALLGYAKRSGPDDFSSLTGFLEQHPKSPWNAALLTGLGLEYYNTAHYSLCLDAWARAWSHAGEATDAKGKAVMDRAAGELAYMYARLGRMTELEALLHSVQNRVFLGPATEKIGGAREGLWNMKNRPEISFRCGPLALHRIKLATDPEHSATDIIHKSASTQKGFSLTQVAELSKKVGLNYQMAFRPTVGTRSTASPNGLENGTRWNASLPFVVPSVVHWKVDHYAALIRQEGDRYLLEDPTFGNTVWASTKALEAETSGYFLIPPGPLPGGWRAVEMKEGDLVWGKGQTGGNGPPPPTPCPSGKGSTGGSDSCNPPCPTSGGAGGMARSTVDLMTVTLSLHDEPVGYSPPIGPPVRFWVRYNHRDPFQPTTFTYSNFGSKWTCDWISYIIDNPQSLSAGVTYYARGGGTRAFTGFDSGTQTFAYQQNDQTRLTRTGPASYEMTWPNGSKLIFSQSDGAAGTSRKVFLTQQVDEYGNALTLTYDGNLRIVAITDALGQVTTLTHGNTNDIYRITSVTDPFGRFATFSYDSLGRLTNITDVIGLNSQFVYQGTGDLISALITPYGTNTFISADSGNTRVLETVYADGSRDRVEYNQTINIYGSDPAASVPTGMATISQFLQFRNTYYWSRNACALGYGDYSKAKVYHWLHSADLSTTSGILESTKEALEGRVWYDYAGQSVSHIVGSTDKPTHVGRVLDDGSTQLYTYAYDSFGHVTNSIDPVGRTFSYIYATNGIDLLETRMTRAGQNELLSRAIYNAHHLPLTRVDAASQTNNYTYNGSGQLLTKTNPKNETTSYAYDTNGYLIMIHGPLPGTNDVVRATYDLYGRIRTKTDESGYTETFEHDAMDRMTRITHPDSSSEQITYDRLDPAMIQDRAGRQTLLEHNALRQLTKRTDPMGRVTQFQWCSCGDIKTLTDPMGRTTTWRKDVQNRLISKQFGDGSQITYNYENTTSRLRQVIDEKLQVKNVTRNRDDTISSIAYANTTVPTPGVSYTYDQNYQRRASMTDGTGITLYNYAPITAFPAPGTGQLESVDGPLPNDTITHEYDELGRRVSTAINGVALRQSYDAGGRATSTTNALGAFAYGYDGSSSRVVSEAFPNGQATIRSYGDSLQDVALQRITYQSGVTPISEFLYNRNTVANRITTWSQQAGAAAPLLYTFSYDAADQLLSGVVTNAGSLLSSFTYNYDKAGNRLREESGSLTNVATHNALNQISTTLNGISRTNEWDGEGRLASTSTGNQRTEFTYDGTSRLVSLRKLVNGLEVSYRRLLWRDDEICEEREASGAVTKRFFRDGMILESGPNAGSYFYTRDHLSSIRELTDATGAVRARYSYDPFGRRTKIAGDLEADFGFAGMFWAAEAAVSIARFRAYDPELGRWSSRDPLRNAEEQQGPNLYAYVGNNPINAVDPMGLACCREQFIQLMLTRAACGAAKTRAVENCNWAHANTPEVADDACLEERQIADAICDVANATVKTVAELYRKCMMNRPKECSCPREPTRFCEPSPDVPYQLVCTPL